MPLYDFKCKKCGHKTFDVLITKKSDDVIQKCGCGSTEWVRLPVNISLRFKGEGWSSKSHSVEEE